MSHIVARSHSHIRVKSEPQIRLKGVRSRSLLPRSALIIFCPRRFVLVQSSQSQEHAASRRRNAPVHPIVALRVDQRDRSGYSAPCRAVSVESSRLWKYEVGHRDHCGPNHHHILRIGTKLAPRSVIIALDRKVSVRATAGRSEMIVYQAQADRGRHEYRHSIGQCRIETIILGIQAN